MSGVNSTSGLSRFLDQLEHVQGSRGLKAVEASVLFTSVAAITNIVVSIIKVVGSLIQLAKGEKNTHFESALKQFSWGVVTLTPGFGGAVALGYLGYKTAANGQKLAEQAKQNNELKKQVTQLERVVKRMELETAGLTTIDFSEQLFPELKNKGLPVVSLLLDPANNTGEYESTATIEEVLETASKEKLKLLETQFKEKKIKVLSMIDIQNGFLNGGSLMVPGAEEKIFKNIEKLLQENEFDLIVMTKDFHPKSHKSFTSRYYTVKETPDSLTLTPKSDGQKIGVKIKPFWKDLPMGQYFNITENNDGSITFTEKEDPKATKGAKLKALRDGDLMPFAKALHPVEITPYMFRNVEQEVDNQNAILEKLKEIGLFSAINTTEIKSDFTIDGKQITAAFDGNGNWDEAFVKGFKEKLGDEYTLEKTKGILGALLEDLWPDHCGVGTKSHQFHEKLVTLLQTHASHIPMVPLIKGNDFRLGEAYSGALNTRGYLASPYLPLLKNFEIEKNVVVGVADKYCPTNTAVDAQKAGIPTTVVTLCTAGITEEDTKAANVLYKKYGVKVVTGTKI